MTYNWNFGDGGTSTSANPSHTYATGGTYNVCLIVTGIDSGSVCYDTICHSITVGLSAVGQLDNNPLTVYPNPTSSHITLELPSTETYLVNLSDVAGRLIRNEYIQSSNKKIMIDITNLSSGVYRLTLSSGNKKYTAKILKQ